MSLVETALKKLQQSAQQGKAAEAAAVARVPAPVSLERAPIPPKAIPAPPVPRAAQHAPITVDPSSCAPPGSWRRSTRSARSPISSGRSNVR